MLRTNLSSGTVSEEELDEETRRKFLGGRGLGVKIISDEVDPRADPLSEENKIVFAVGPLTKTPAPTSGRYAVVSKSPLTGTIADSNSGGFFAPMLKGIGHDAVIVEGESDDPVYIWANEDGAEIRDASSIWGMETREATDEIREETHESAEVACIGPAGEEEALLACIINSKHRAAGRGGLGAVMGSKNLKALAVHGTEVPSLADRERFMEAVEKCRMTINKNPVTKDSLSRMGTPALVSIMEETGILPTSNFRRGTFENSDGVSGQKYLERIFEESYACAGCPIGCGRITKADGESGGGPEYETVWAFGPELEISRLEDIAKANYLCNRLGLDTISTGSTIGCAMELSEKGYLDRELEFGDEEEMLDLVEKAGNLEGFGERIANGSKRLAEECGHPEASMTVKGMEIPAYDPRGVQGQALSYATSNRGGCHLRAYMIGPEILGSPTSLDRFKAEGKAAIVKLFQDFSATVDSLNLCRFTSIALTLEQYSELLSAGTGIEYDADDFKKVGERIWNLERLFNVKAGFDRGDDTLPKRFLETPLEEGNSRDRTVELEEMLDEYYEVRNWTEDGVPRESLLEDLGIEEYAV